MSGYNSNADPATLTSVVAQNSKLRGEAFSRLLEASSRQHNPFLQFTSATDKTGKGVGSIFATKRDLRAGGGDRVNFSVIGTPAGPGVKGEEELTGNTSKSSLYSWNVRVDWYRDAVEYTKNTYEFLAAGGNLMRRSIDLLGHKMGIHERNDMMMRLIKGADGNVMRPNNRGTVNKLTTADTLTLDSTVSFREKISTLGGMPIRQTYGPNQSPIQGYLVFGTQVAFNPIRNDDGFQLALSNGHARGEKNANFTGEMIDWQGTPFYEMLGTDEAWDDYLGNAMLPKAKIGTEVTVDTASASLKLIANSSNTKNLYFQFFDGYDYHFYSDDQSTTDSTVYYAWAVNPDGSVAFVSYTGSDNDGNLILVKNILATAAGTSTKGAKKVGEVDLGTAPTKSGDIITPDSDANVPADFTYTDKIQVGAIVIQANSSGVPYGRSFVFGAMAAAFAYGRYAKELISEKRDFDFVHGRGFETVFGTNVCLNALGKPVNYLLIEHAIEHASYPTPSV